MSSVGVVRTADALGRIVLPKGLRGILELPEKCLTLWALLLSTILRGRDIEACGLAYKTINRYPSRLSFRGLYENKVDGIIPDLTFEIILMTHNKEVV